MLSSLEICLRELEPFPRLLVADWNSFQLGLDWKLDRFSGDRPQPPISKLYSRFTEDEIEALAVTTVADVPMVDQDGRVTHASVRADIYRDLLQRHRSSYSAVYSFLFVSKTFYDVFLRYHQRHITITTWEALKAYNRYLSINPTVSSF